MIPARPPENVEAQTVTRLTLTRLTLASLAVSPRPRTQPLPERARMASNRTRSN
jgi:hypothetical protein